MAFKKRAGVLEVLFGVGLGGGDAGKRFVQHADDPLLFGQWRNGQRKFVEPLFRDMDKADCTTNRFYDCSRNFPQSVKRISTIDLFLEADLENMLVENSRLTIPEVGSKGGSHRSRPREQQITRFDKNIAAVFASEVVERRVFTVEILNADDR